MSISIDPQEGGPIEGLFGSQVEQRIGHHVEHDNESSRARRTSESDSRLLGAQSAQRSLSVPPYSLKSGSSNYRRASPWWGSRLYNKISRGILPTTNMTTSATAARPGIIHYIQINLTALATLVVGIVNTKRRKSWFLSLILISLALTVLSGGYLLSQFQHQRDHMPPAVSVSDNGNGDLILDSGSGEPRRDRSRGKKQRAPNMIPTSQAKKNETTIFDTVKNMPNNPGIGDKGAGNPDDMATGSRICNLEDVTDGQWVYSKVQSQVPEWGSDQDMGWTGYGHNGCKSTIWNERYLLTPTIANSTTPGYHHSIVQNDWEYARHVRNFQWQLAHTTKGNCTQPEVDVEDFVEVLKRSPLVMIGDKFLEQEYLTIECLVMGMQSQLVYDYQLENKKPVDQRKMKEALEYWIESETPSIVEFKIAPQSTGGIVGISSPGKSRPAVYRKAKPGQMRLVDRVSNLTLVTFIRSDVLWDSDMLAKQTNKHPLKSGTELSSLDLSGLHPDCRLAGGVLLCEPARIDSTHDSGTEGNELSTTKHWWQWWIGAEDNLETIQSQSEDDDDEDIEVPGEDMSFGSDFDHDMINLGWVRSLKDIVQDAKNPRTKTITGTLQRKPVVIISNGHFWEYNPQDVAALFSLEKTENQIEAKRALTKVEKDQLRKSQIKRRKLLRQRYTMVMTNMLDYIKATYPDLRVMVQTSVRCGTCGTAANSETIGQEAARLNALTKTVVARMQDPLYSFLDTTFLRLFRDSVANKRYCSNFMMPGPLDTLVQHLYGELYRLDL